MLELVWVLFAHWVADFICQSDYVAKNKPTDDSILLVHILTYTTILGVLTLNPLFAAVNGMTHLFIDYFTSRASSRLYHEGRTHDFFVVIGFDQFLHTAILISTWRFFS